MSEEILRQKLLSLLRTEIPKHNQLLHHSETIVGIVQRCLEESLSRLQHSANEGQQVGATPTTTETSPSGPNASAADADGEPKTPRGS